MVSQTIFVEKGRLGPSLPGGDSAHAGTTQEEPAWQVANDAIRAITQLQGVCCYCFDERRLPSPPGTTSEGCAFHKMMLALASHLHRIARHCHKRSLEVTQIATLWSELDTISARAPQSNREAGLYALNQRVDAMMAELGVTEGQG